MLPDSLSIALKEWALVQRAMLEGRQILLLRKGGLIEETGDFDLKAPAFLIMPTFIHETERAGDVQPACRAWLRAEEARRPAENRILFEAACKVTSLVRVEDREPLKALAASHVWSDSFIDGRFDWEPYKPVFALLCRAFRLPAPVEIPYESDYGGCRSWVELRAPIDTRGARPVLDYREYSRRAAEIARRLAG